MTNPVFRALVNPEGDPALDVFVAWCSSKGVRPFVLSPADISLFVRESHPLGIDQIAASVAAISKAYMARGLADPCAGGPVAAALHSLAPIEPPNSWPTDMRPRFAELSYRVQHYLAARDSEDQKVIKRALNDAADARKEAADARELAAQQQPKEVTENGETAAA